VRVARIEKQLDTFCALDELPRGGQVLLGPLVVLHHVDLERHALGPRVAELRSRQRGTEEQRAARAGTGLRQQLRRHHAE